MNKYCHNSHIRNINTSENSPCIPHVTLCKQHQDQQNNVTQQSNMMISFSKWFFVLGIFLFASKVHEFQNPNTIYHQEHSRQTHAGPHHVYAPRPNVSTAFVLVVITVKVALYLYIRYRKELPQAAKHGKDIVYYGSITPNSC